MWRRARMVAVLVFCAVGLASQLRAGQGGQGHGNGLYHVGVGDVITVDSFQHDEISGEFLVEDGGFVTYPFLGAVPVEGLTCAVISRTLEELLERDYYVDVQIVVEVTEYRSQPVTVLGEVGKPGTYYLKGPTNLLQILVEAGGIRSSAGGEVELRRRKGGSEEAAQQVMTFSTAEVISGEQGGNILLVSGDVIVVLSAKAEYFITGEVARPGRYEVTQGMTVLQALSEAGGEAKFSSGVIELHRDVDGQKQIYEFNLGHIRKGRIADPEIQAGDVLILRKRFF